jgi:serine protease AprX
VQIPFFAPNYPDPSGRFSLLSTPERVGAPPAYTGRGVVMAFIDSGFFPHPDLGERVLVHADASSGRIIEGRRFHRPEWYSWHGQMTSVIAAGDGRTSGGKYRGIACEARLVLIKTRPTQRRGHPTLWLAQTWRLLGSLTQLQA